ncbi:flagellar hook-basal body complex protein FliE [Iodobacter sp.]|uniref:flagellar hook-basal body complex protein FliE n=1 Tax=Iodobacter sp. TaxID=1915058 RepID=UPI0025DD9072|nr:flagellar hook-basal body complex protein FliE [Iodobacter sp.]
MVNAIASALKTEQTKMLGEMAAISGNSQYSPAEHSQGSGGFMAIMANAVRNVDQQEQQAASKMADVDSGASNDLVGAMLMSQEASLSFSMMTQVRNKVMAAVDDLMKMPL